MLVNYGPAYGTVCASDASVMDRTEATIICRQLGYDGDSYDSYVFYAAMASYPVATGMLEHPVEDTTVIVKTR